MLLGVCLYGNLMAQADIKSKLISADYKDVKLSDVIADISKRYDIQFSFNSSLAEGDAKITLHAKGQPFEKFVAELCNKAHLEFEIINGNVVLKKPLHKHTGFKNPTPGRSGGDKDSGFNLKPGCRKR